MEEAEVNGLVAQLKSDRARYQQQLARKQKEMSELKRKTDELIKKKTAEAKKKATTAVDAALSSSFAANKGKLPWPVEGTVTGSFGSHPHPVYKNVTMPFNNGVNVAVVRNAAVKAVSAGSQSGQSGMQLCAAAGELPDAAAELIESREELCAARG